MERIKNKSLFSDKVPIGKEWIGNANHESFAIYNPANGKEIGQLPNLKEDGTKTAIQEAEAAFKIWRKVSAPERSSLLYKWYQLIMDNSDDLATLMVSEQGKPFAEAKGEVIYAAKFVQWFSEQAKRIHGVVMSDFSPTARLEYTKEPVGVVGVITPWNFPLAMITRKVAPALAAGCTCIIKPSDLTPYSAIALVKLAKEAGIIDGACNIVTTVNPQIFGEVIASSKVVRKLSFTGSTKVGKLLLRQSAETVKKVSLELGGNAPFIVFEDADIDVAVKALITTKFRNTGQTCVCANRIFVHKNIENEFIDKLKIAVQKFIVGDGFTNNVSQGPLINSGGFDKVKTHVKTALNSGAELVLGGKQHQLGYTFYEPTILKGVQSESIFKYEETFGPVAPIISFSDTEEAIMKANETDYGLAAYFCSQNFKTIEYVKNQLEAGIVGINEGLISSEFGPFGGVKESGLGREGSVLGIEEYLETKYSLLNFS